MIPLLIAPRTQCKADIKRPLPQRNVSELAPRNTQTVDDWDNNEEAYISKLIVGFLVLVIFPAVLALLYIALNPTAFMTDITPTSDLSTWQP